jgi:predicted ATPase
MIGRNSPHDRVTPALGGLPPEYQLLLKLAEEKHHLAVTPLQELKGGRTGALLYLASVATRDPRRVEHFVVKLDRVNPRSKSTEGERHRQALQQAPAVFADRNMAKVAHEIEHEGAIALFYTVAGQSLQHFRTLAAQESQSRLEALFTATADHLLRSWNADAAVEQALHPQKVLQRWLGYRLKADGPIGSFLGDVFRVAPETQGFIVEGQVFPNPLSYGLDAAQWGEARPIDILIGFQHGDLNIGNILARFEEGSEVPKGYFLIDFALYKAQMPLLYDLCYLEMSYLVRELERAPFPKWVSLVTLFSSRDIPNPRDVPVELAGACAVINEGRKAFDRWVHESRPSLSDDLWGQLRLAAVAAGLNYCNKTALTTEERLAGLIYAAAHLKRYCERFGVPPPDDVGPLFDSSKWDRGAPARWIAAAPASRRTHLPSQPTPFIGREAEVKAVADLLMREDVRLVSALGPGGTGKTRLALRVATDSMDRFEDGVFFVDLAPIREPESVLGAIARAVGLRETSDGQLLDELKGHLQARRVLLLLDNFEHVTAAAPGVGELLRDCSRLKLLVTSREALHIRDEHVFPVPPLGLPEPDVERPSIEQLGRYEAVRLFVDRAQAVKPDFELTSENASAVAEICRRLDGLPLAIELATARIGLFSPQALLERVESRLKLLRGGARDLPARQQTLRDTIGWSHELLDSGEQRLFAMFSVFRGGTLEAVEGVASGIEDLEQTGVDALERLASLVDKSLIRQEETGTGGPRLVMLETIREYAAERLKEDPELSAAARSAHAAYYADFTRRRWERLSGDGREAALREMESDVENVREAWRHWVAERDLEQLRKLADCLWLLYDARGWYHAMVESTGDLLEVLASAPEAPDRAEQEIMLRISLARALMAVKGCTPEVEEAYTGALELCEGQGEIPQLLPVLRGLASFYIYVADFEKGARMGEQILRLAERHDDVSMRVEGHVVLGYSLAFLRDLALGQDHLDKAIALYDADQDRSRRFRMGSNPGVASRTTSALVLWMLGRPDQALERAGEAMALAGKLNHPFSLAYAHFHTALLHLWRREVEAVEERARTVLDVAEKHEFQIWRAVATCLHGAALVGMGRAEEGLTESNQGMELYRGLKTPPVFWPLLLFTQAGALGEAGRPADGLARLDEAMEVVGHESESPFASQLCRLKGELLVGLSPESPAEAEPWLQRALEIARAREATNLELQAALGLARLWRAQGEPDQGRRLLSDVYGRFTEGFATADLEDARVLLAKLSQESGQRSSPQA